MRTWTTTVTEIAKINQFSIIRVRLFLRRVLTTFGFLCGLKPILDMNSGMDGSDFFNNPLNAVTLLSVYSHLNILSNFLHSEHFLAEDDQFESIPIVNSLYEYFEKNDHNTSIKSNIVHRLLAGSDLYGAKSNESIDPDYVEAMFNYIVGDILFKRYGNIHGFLAWAMLTTRDLTLASFEKGIRFNLLITYHPNENGLDYYLSELAVEKIMDTLILPLFPEAVNNISIVSPEYIYAQAGLAFARAAKMDLENISFEELVEISQTLESSVLEAQIDDEALSIFALPATLYYFHTEKNLLSEEALASVVTGSDYWVSAYEKLFTYLNSTFGKLHETLKDTQEKSPLTKFRVIMSQYKTRTQLAEENIRLHCPLENEDDYEEAISEYKNNPEDYYCEKYSTTLPDVNNIFNEQNEEIADQYSSMEKKLIEDAFQKSTIQFINSSDIIVYESVAESLTIVYEPEYGALAVYSPKMKDSVDLLEIYNIPSGTTVYYALIREDDGMILIEDVNRDEFNDKIGSEKDSVFERTTTVLKHNTDTFETFANRIASIRADRLKNMLQEKGYEETNWERAMTIILSFIPFYNCVGDIIQSEKTNALMDCGLDVLSFVPVYGVAVKIGVKIFSKTLLMTLGTSIRSFAFRESILLTLRTLGRGVLSQAVTEFSNVLTKETFKSISISLLRSLDPGFELLGRLTKAGIKSTTRLLSLIKRQLSPSLFTKITNSLEKLKKSVQHRRIGEFGGRDLYVNTLSGTDGFGRKYISTPNGVFEVRKILGSKYEQPIQLERVVNGKNIYRKVDIETGTTYGLDLEFRKDILQTVVPSLSERIRKIKTIGLSGRGAFAGSRKLRKLNKEIRDAEALDVLNDSLEKIHINRDQAQKILRRYLLEQEGRTELDFAKHWSLFLEVPHWVSGLKLYEPDLFWKLRLEKSLVSEEIDYNDAVSKIKKIYAQHDLQEMGVDVDEVVEIFNDHNARFDVMFEDLYAIMNYVGTGYHRIREETAEARRMKNAFYRLAIRQADDFEESPRFLYRAEKKHVDVAKSFTEGYVIEINRFTSTSKAEDVAFIYLDIIPEDPAIVPILYEIELDSPFLAADIYKLCPTYEEESVLIPGVKLIVDKVQHIITADGRTIKKLTVRNLAVNKSQWLIHLMKKIEELKESGTQFYFDTLGEPKE